MRAVWAQVALLRDHRIAHRDLRRANVFVQDDGVPWLIDFGFSEVAVPDGILDADVAQMLASFAVVVGAERAVGAAVDATRSRCGGRRTASPPDEGVERRDTDCTEGTSRPAQDSSRPRSWHRQVSRRCSSSELERINSKTVFIVALLAAVTYFLRPAVRGPARASSTRSAPRKWEWTPLILLGSAMTYVGAAISLAGAIPDRLPTGPLFVSTVGSSFASKLAPAGIGGMALNVRFLQKQGVDEPVAVSRRRAQHDRRSGRTRRPHRRVHRLGRRSDAFGSFELPDPKWFVIGIWSSPRWSCGRDG